MADRSGLVAVPRAWLLGLAALLIVPWLIAAAVYVLRSDEGRATALATGAAGGAVAPTPGQQGPWGQLEVTPIVISPPLEFVPSNWGPIEPPQWRFPQTNRQELEQFLLSTGLDRAQAGQLLQSARPEPRINGLIVSPDSSLVRNLAPPVRAAIYIQLAKTPLNYRQENAYRHYAPSVDAWLGRRLVSPRTLSLVEPLVYSYGGFLYFSDIDLVRQEIDGPELQRLAKGLLRESTLLVRLRVNDVSQVDAAAEYWGRGGRRTDIRPLLESIAVAGQGQSIDISHLLPPMARQYLYRYPRISLKDFDKPSFANCFWTALNFFNEKPDDLLLDPPVAIERLKRDYYIVQDQFQFGDIAAFAGADGGYFHAAVYLADGLVFGKNGTSPLAPWTIVPIDRLKGYYVERADEWNIVYYRRKDL